VPQTTTFANWTLGVGLSVPVLDRPRLLAEARASGFRAEQAVLTYEKAVQTAFGEADNALVLLAADRRRVDLLTAGEAQALASYEAARRRYDLGLDDLTTLLSAEQAWRNARTANIAARTQALRRSVQAYKALGGGWTAEAPST
jgi:outer membrane protein TolC